MVATSEQAHISCTLFTKYTFTKSRCSKSNIALTVNHPTHLVLQKDDALPRRAPRDFIILISFQ